MIAAFAAFTLKEMESTLEHSKFPIVIKIISGHLILYSPDFGTALQERITSSKPEEVALKVGLAYLDMQRKLELSIREHKREERPVPGASALQFAMPKDEFIPIGVASSKLGLGKDTVRRMAQRGELEFKRTPGGHYRVKLPIE